MRTVYGKVLVAVLLVTALMFIGAAGVMATDAASPETQEAAVVSESWAGSKVLWASLTMLFATFATSFAQSRIGIAGAGAMSEKPELSGTYIILIAIPETMVILGFVVAAMILTM